MPTNVNEGASEFLNMYRASVTRDSPHPRAYRMKSDSNTRIVFWRTVLRIAPERTNAIVKTGSTKWATASANTARFPEISASIVYMFVTMWGGTVIDDSRPKGAGARCHRK